MHLQVDVACDGVLNDFDARVLRVSLHARADGAKHDSDAKLNLFSGRSVLPDARGVSAHVGSLAHVCIGLLHALDSLLFLHALSNGLVIRCRVVDLRLLVAEVGKLHFARCQRVCLVGVDDALVFHCFEDALRCSGRHAYRALRLASARRRALDAASGRRRVRSTNFDQRWRLCRFRRCLCARVFGPDDARRRSCGTRCRCGSGLGRRSRRCHWNRSRRCGSLRKHASLSGSDRHLHRCGAIAHAVGFRLVHRRHLRAASRWRWWRWCGRSRRDGLSSRWSKQRRVDALSDVIELLGSRACGDVRACHKASLGRLCQRHAAIVKQRRLRRQRWRHVGHVGRQLRRVRNARGLGHVARHERRALRVDFLHARHARLGRREQLLPGAAVTKRDATAVWVKCVVVEWHGTSRLHWGQVRSGKDGASLDGRALDLGLLLFFCRLFRRL